MSVHVYRRPGEGTGKLCSSTETKMANRYDDLLAPQIRRKRTG